LEYQLVFFSSTWRYKIFHFPVLFSLSFSLFNLLFFCIFQIFSLFNLLFFCIFHITSYDSISLQLTTHYIYDSNHLMKYLNSHKAMETKSKNWEREKQIEICFHYSTYFSSVFSKSFHYSTYFSSVFSISFHYSTYLSSIFSISFHNATYFSSIFSISFHLGKIWKKKYEKYGRKINWIVKRYGKYGRKVSWIVKW
jgi:hypothetical protein